jgi:hypothetical protein
MRAVWDRITTCLREEYGVVSAAPPIAEAPDEKTA